MQGALRAAGAAYRVVKRAAAPGRAVNCYVGAPGAWKSWKAPAPHNAKGIAEGGIAEGGIETGGIAKGAEARQA